MDNGFKTYTEEEAAAAFNVKPNVLRDARKRGEIAYSRIWCGRVRYMHDDLVEYMSNTRVPATKIPSVKQEAEAAT